MKVFNFTKKMNVKTFLVSLAFFGLSMSAVYAQTPYIITGNGTLFTVYKDGLPIQTNQPMATVIEAIQMNSAGINCTIQFGNDNVLDLGGGNSTLIRFTGNWGKITLTGKATSANTAAGIISLENDISLECKAELTATGTGNTAMFINTSTGTLTVSGGIVKAIGNGGRAIYNISTGAVNISGGTVSSYNHIAVDNGYEGKITVSGTALVTSDNPTNNFGAIFLYSGGMATNCRLEITGGMVKATGNNGSAVRNDSRGVVNISGGTVSATTGKAIYNASEGEINISGGTVSSGIGNAIYSEYGKTNISGGTVHASFGNAIEILGTLNISGGRISTDGDFSNAISTEYGFIDISGGTVSATTGYALGNHEGNITFSGGILFAYGTTLDDVISEYSYVTQTENAVVVAWNKDAGNTIYQSGTSNDIYKFPVTATAIWRVPLNTYGGIWVNYNTTTGFIPNINPYISIIPSTYDNLYASVQGEMNASAAYNAFAVQAETEGYSVIARLFRATSDAEAKHADDEWAILQSMGAIERPMADAPTVGTTAQNLQAAFDGETYEYTVMYPGFLATAQAEGMTAAAQIFRWAMRAEEVHASNYKDVLDNLADTNYINTKYAVLYRCLTCGEVVTLRPATCPICGAAGSSFVIYNGSTSIANIATEKIKIYPNPTKSELKIESNDLLVEKVEILDIAGKIILTSHETTINISQFSAGIYFVKLKTDKGELTKKIIKE